MHFFDNAEIEGEFAMKIGGAAEIVTNEPTRAEQRKRLAKLVSGGVPIGSEFLGTNFGLPFQHALNEMEEALAIFRRKVGEGLAFAGEAAPDFSAERERKRERSKLELPFGRFAARIGKHRETVGKGREIVEQAKAFDAGHTQCAGGFALTEAQSRRGGNNPINGLGHRRTRQRAKETQCLDFIQTRAKLHTRLVSLHFDEAFH